jgi:SAM-dependent methyltransferase
LEEIQCIFCRENSDWVVIEENGFQGRKCPKCNLIYVSPRPSLSEIQNLYSHDEAHISAGTHIFGAFRRRLLARHALRIIGEHSNGGSILEIGSGSGYFLEEAKKNGYDAYGIELNNILAEFTRSQLGIPCEGTPLGDRVFNGIEFDIVYHRDVISHFYDPISEFQRINRRLARKGLVVFETGNLGEVNEKYYRMFSEFQFPDHLFFFSEENLRELLRRTGFEVVKIYRYSILPQLRFFGAIDRVVGSIQPLKRARRIDEDEKSQKAASIVSGEEVQGASAKQLVKNVYNYLYYAIRYKVGRAMPKRGRPQTLIIVARKSSSIQK